VSPKQNINLKPAPLPTDQIGPKIKSANHWKSEGHRLYYTELHSVRGCVP